MTFFPDLAACLEEFFGFLELQGDVSGGEVPGRSGRNTPPMIRLSDGLRVFHVIDELEGASRNDDADLQPLCESARRYLEILLVDYSTRVYIYLPQWVPVELVRC